MPQDKMLQITDDVAIPRDELRFRFSRSGGPGGQRVNRVETQVELLFAVRASAALTERQKDLIESRLKGYIDKDGVLHLVAHSTRSQAQNREEVIERFRKLLAEALRPRKRRLPTKPGRGARERRLAFKRRRGERKRQRRRPEIDEDLY